MEPTLFFLCGLPGSGKSTFAKQLQQEEDAMIFSSDKIREEMYGTDPDSLETYNIHSKEANAKVFTELNKQIKEALLNGHNVVYDATNINSKRRAAFLRELKNIPCHKKCYIILRTFNDCIKANRHRNNAVPNSVIENMYKNWNTPYYFEGWDQIYALFTDYNRGCNGRAIELPYTFKDYDQCNKHHALSLGDHLYKCWENLEEKICELEFDDLDALSEAAFAHDIGKPYTKTFQNYAGELTIDAHYYNHQNVGAYEALFLQTDYPENLLLISILINLHMQPYFWASDHTPEKTQKLHEKYRNIWGKELYELVMTLHRADVAAH